MDRESRSGWWISGTAHTGLILWAVLGGFIFRPQPAPAIRMTEVATMSSADFEAYAAAARGSAPGSAVSTSVDAITAPDLATEGANRAPANASPPVVDAQAQPLSEPDARTEPRPDLSDFNEQPRVSVTTTLTEQMEQPAPEATPARPADPEPPVAAGNPAQPAPATPDSVTPPVAQRSALALDSSALPQPRPAGLVEARAARLAAEAERIASEAAEQLRLEDEARAEEQRRAADEAAAEQRREAAEQAAAEAARQAEAEQRRLDQARAADEQRQADEARAAEARAEAARAADERRAAEAEARAEQQRRADEADAQRRAEDARAAEQQRREAEARAEEARQAREAEARADEQRRAAEARAEDERRRALEDALREARDGQTGDTSASAAETGADPFGGAQRIDGGLGASANQDPLAAALSGALSQGAAPAPEPAPVAPMQLLPSPLAPSDDVASTSLPVGIPLGDPLTLSERDSFRLAIRDCWNVGALSVESSRMTVSVEFRMTPDGRPEPSSLRMVDFRDGSATAAAHAFDVASRAIRMCGRNGFALPAEKYGRWQDVIVDFRPDGIGFE